MARLNWWHQRSVLKSGKPGNRIIWIPAPFCPLDVCEQCGRLGSAQWVKKWWYRPWRAIDLRFRHQPPPEPVLCMGCYNKIRPVWKAQCEAYELGALTRKLKREIASVRRAENNR